MNSRIVVDSSGWLEYFADGPAADEFAIPILQPSVVVVPAICLYEVCRVSTREANSYVAAVHCGGMRRGEVVAVDEDLAIDAGSNAAAWQLGMADALIYATARRTGAELWTMYADFTHLPGVRVIPHQ